MARRRKSKFKKSLLVYLGISFILSMLIVIYIYFTLISYEANQTGNFLATTIKNIDEETLKKYLVDNNKDTSLLDSYKNKVKSNDMKYAKIGEDLFEASLNGRLMFTIETRVVAEKTKLAFFSYQEREVIKITPNLERGFIYYDVTVPSNFKIYLDDTEYDSDYASAEKYNGLSFMYYNESMPQMATYNINDLDSEKKVTIKDFLDNEVKLEQKDYKYFTNEYHILVDKYENLPTYVPDLVDVAEVAHNWSLFMTKDLSGAYYGLSTISKYLITGTSIYQMAYSWAHSVDITFTSRHSLKNPIFSDEVIDNCKLYGNAAFSCDVAFTKNMVVNGKDQPDKMHDTLSFIKDSDGNWKLINIQSIEEKNE